LDIGGDLEEELGKKKRRRNRGWGATGAFVIEVVRVHEGRIEEEGEAVFAVATTG
jgi:hypothetical protein